MRLLLTLAVLLSIAVFLAEAKRKSKEEWRQKKINSKLSRYSDSYGKMEKKHHDLGKYDKGFNGRNSRRDMKMQKRKNKKGKKHFKFGHGDMSWVTVVHDYECKVKCERGEVCIQGPIDDNHVCVHKKDLKKSVKLFHKFQKKEMKAWRKFKKEKYNHHLDEEEDFLNMKKHKLALMKKDYIKRLGVKNGMEGSDLDYDEMEKHMKHKPGKHMKHMGKHWKEMDDNTMEKPETGELSIPMAPVEAGSIEECETSQFSQMRSRLMGWFHLLHGQDHLARKAHGGNLKHFYKHVSVKKELRENNGDKCECLKSAMWQFHQMDVKTDDFLDKHELLPMEQDNMEPCLKPYLTSCDRNADSRLSSDEWCCCFSNVVAPCFKKLDDLRLAGDTESYVPACDKEGYYMREQCGGELDKEVTCWCVDYNGNELKGTRTKGRAHCHKKALHALESEKSASP